MYLRQLAYFSCVANNSSISAAAEELHVSQPALSTQIKNLEENLGFDLLKRKSRGIELTRAGERFLISTKDILERVNRAGQDLADYMGQVEGEVSLGLTPSIGRLLLSTIVDEVSAKYPGITIACKQGYSDEMVAGVKSGELNLAFSNEIGDESHMSATPLLAQELCLIGPPEIVGPNGESIEFSEIPNLKLIQERKTHATRNLIEGMAKTLNIDLNVKVDADPISIRKQMMASHQHCTISMYGLFCDEIHDEDLAARPINSPEMVRVLYMISKKDKELRPIDRVVQEIIEEQIKKGVSQGLYHWHEPDWLPAP